MKNAIRTEGAGQHWKAFALLVVTYFITIVDFTIVNVALPAIGRDLRFSESDLQWVVTAYGLTFAGFVLLGGRAADLLGRRRVLMSGLAVFSAASFGGGLATSDTVLIVMRGMQGLGAALVLPAALSIVVNLFSEGAERNKALGIWGGVGALGGTVGLLAGGILTTYAGWPYIFFFNVPIGAAALALAPKVVPESRSRSGPRRYDTFGAVSITAALLVLVYAISQAPQAGWASTQTVVMLAAGAALLALFLVVETRVEAPLLPLPLFRLRSVAGSNAVGFLLGTSFITFVFLGTLYMQQVLGFSALATGAAWMTASVTSLSLALTGLSQRLVTRTSPKLVMTFGMALIGAGMLWATQAWLIRPASTRCCAAAAGLPRRIVRSGGCRRRGTTVPARRSNRTPGRSLPRVPVSRSTCRRSSAAERSADWPGRAPRTRPCAPTAPGRSTGPGATGFSRPAGPAACPGVPAPVPLRR